MGRLDHYLRLALAAALVVVGIIVGPLGWVSALLYAVAVVLTLTATLSFCPIYFLLGIQTCPRDPDALRGRH
ncbi:YgaP family membrane protein [Nocardioides sp. GXZ039]|uniref:YgaP family membrane protein n=1 Tax=Nocardioides sp. GXZ039 TaxID=3136018 RepID=UPI0030F49DCA